MSRIDELIAEHCPDGVEFRFLGDIVKNFDRLRKPVTKSSRVAGPYPYYGANGIQDYVQDFIFDGTFLLIGEDGSVKNANGTPVLNWATGKIWVNNHAHILQAASDALNLRYLYFYLQTVDISAFVTGGTQPKLNQKNMNAIQIALPPLEVQRAIVEILDTFSWLEAELEAELEARKQQYEHYRAELLTSSDNTTFMPLGSVVRIRNGKDHKHLGDGEIPVYGSGGIMRNVEAASASGPSVLIPRKGSLGNIFYVEGPFWNVDTIFNTEVDSSLIEPKFLFHQLSTMKLGEMNQAGGVPSQTQSVLNRLQISVPTLDEQRRIVDILDNFDALVNDLSLGLPAELAARRQQYEYYRDKLLTFKEVEVAA